MNKNTSFPSIPSVKVSCKRAGRAVNPQTVKRRASKILIELGESESELSVLLCNDELMQKLNRDYRKKNKPTDVLSFPLRDDHSPEEKMLGDVVISVETAVRQAKRRGRTIRQEVTHLLIHGILHLCGYDHNTSKKEVFMHRMSKKIEQIFTS